MDNEKELKRNRNRARPQKIRKAQGKKRFWKEIENVTIENEMQTSYLDYSMSVIIGRAIPDIRDGLKPVHRRSLYSMHQTGTHYNKPYKKSARIVGGCDREVPSPW